MAWSFMDGLGSEFQQPCERHSGDLGVHKREHSRGSPGANRRETCSGLEVLPEKFYVPAQGVGETDVVYRENLRRHGGEVVPVLAGLVAGDADDTKDLSCRLTVDGCRDDHVHVESAFVEIEHAPCPVPCRATRRG